MLCYNITVDKDYCPDMKAYKIGRVEYAKGEVKTQRDAVLFED